MKKLLFVLMLAVVSSNAMAEWTQIGDDAEGGVKTFVRKDAIAKNEDRALMWTLKDYENPIKVGNKKQFSSMSLEEYDCKEMQYKTLTFYWYSKQKAKGKTVYSDNSNSNIQPIIQDSLTHAAWKIACGK